MAGARHSVFSERVSGSHSSRSMSSFMSVAESAFQSLKLRPLARRVWLSAAVWACLVTYLVPPVAASEWVYTVRPGDNLWDITEKHLTHIRFAKHLQSLNKIEDPWHILPGTRLRIPLDWVRLQPASARVVEVQGKVSARRARGKQSVSVVPGIELLIGDVLTTGPDASTLIEFGDGSRMLVEPDSELVFDMLRAYGSSGFVDTRIRLNKGRTEHRVSPRFGRDGPRYEIITPAATSAVRGTTYRMGSSDTGETSATEVLGGSVKLEAAGDSRLIPEGFGLLARRNEPPAPPRRLLEPPNFEHAPPVFDRVPVQMELPAVAGASSYRVQVADTEQFRILRYDRMLKSPRVRDLNLPDGRYVLRQRGVDEKGLEGLDGYLRFTIDARPEPPILVGPAADTRFTGDRIELAWARPEGAAAYHLQVSRDPAFTNTLLDETEVTDERFPLKELSLPGDYFWRVATRNEQGETGPFGDSQRFKRLADAPELEVSGIEDEAIVFRWSRGLSGDSYDFQFARDPDFSDILLSKRLQQPSYRMDRPQSGSYFLRVRTVDAAGDPGPFGTTQRVQIPPASYWPLVIPVIMVLIAL